MEKMSHEWLSSSARSGSNGARAASASVAANVISSPRRRQASRRASHALPAAASSTNDGSRPLACIVLAMASSCGRWSAACKASAGRFSRQSRSTSVSAGSVPDSATCAVTAALRKNAIASRMSWPRCALKKSREAAATFSNGGSPGYVASVGKRQP